MAAEILYLVLCGAIAAWALELFGLWDAAQQHIENQWKEFVNSRKPK